jgi:diadenosine tetraphosphate (Ap4A) HIT family hydrolase
MAYKVDIWRFKDSTEYEYKYAGRYGAAGEKRSERRKATPEQIKKQNQRNREKRIRRIIKANFKEHDLWITLKYPAGTKKEIDEASADLTRFLRKLKRRYAKKSEPLKYIYRIEIGKKGGVHVHILINRTEGSDIDVKRSWNHGYINITPIYDAGGYKDLAEYIVKAPPEDGQLSLLPEEVKKITRYSSSRNLIRPVPETKEYKRRTLERVIHNGPIPTAGYYIDQDSYYAGINPYTGMSYLCYTEIRITKKRE